MFGSLGFPEILVILVLALLIFGPKRLPEVGRTIGKGLAEFRRATNDLKRSVNAEMSLDVEDDRPATSRRPAAGMGRTPTETSTTRGLPAASDAEEVAGTAAAAAAEARILESGQAGRTVRTAEASEESDVTAQVSAQEPGEEPARAKAMAPAGTTPRTTAADAPAALAELAEPGEPGEPGDGDASLTPSTSTAD